METMGIIVLVALTISIGVGGFAFYKTYDGDWVCIMDECVDYATGNEWISENCRPEGEGENISLVCEVEFNDEMYNAPLSIINLSHPAIKSCKEYVCSRQVFVK